MSDIIKVIALHWLKSFKKLNYLTGRFSGGPKLWRSKLWSVENMAEFSKTRHISTHHRDIGRSNIAIVVGRWTPPPPK